MGPWAQLSLPSWHSLSFLKPSWLLSAMCESQWHYLMWSILDDCHVVSWKLLASYSTVDSFPKPNPTADLQSFVGSCPDKYDPATKKHDPCSIPVSLVDFKRLRIEVHISTILIIHNLRKRKMIVVNTCPICLVDEETIDQLLVNCKMAQQLWNSALRWFDLWWVLPRTISDLYNKLGGQPSSL